MFLNPHLIGRNNHFCHLSSFITRNDYVFNVINVFVFQTAIEIVWQYDTRHRGRCLCWAK